MCAKNNGGGLVDALCPVDFRTGKSTMSDSAEDYVHPIPDYKHFLNMLVEKGHNVVSRFSPIYQILTPNSNRSLLEIIDQIKGNAQRR